MGPLIVVFLRGGADGLSLAPPTGDADYASVRSGLAVAEGAANLLDGTFAMHPALGELHARFVRGEVALVPACGIPELSRSHFDAQFRVEEAGKSSGSGDGTGWLGRHLASSAGDTNPFRGVSFGQAGVPRLLAGSADVVTATTLTGLSIGNGRLDPFPQFTDTLEEMWATSASPIKAAAVSGFGALRTASSISAGGSDGRDHGVADTVATLNAGVGAEVAVVNIGGWDTHDNQGTNDGAFASLAADLDGSIDALMAGVPGATVVVITEFGRRVAPNSSGGCDHGRGSLVVVAGPEVNGGVKGDWPGLSDLDEGDVRTVNDIRVVMAEVTGAVLGTDPAQVVPESPGGSLDLFT